MHTVNNPRTFIICRLLHFTVHSSHIFRKKSARSDRISAIALPRMDCFASPVLALVTFHLSKIFRAIISVDSSDCSHPCISVSSKPSTAARRMHSLSLLNWPASLINASIGFSSDILLPVDTNDFAVLAWTDSCWAAGLQSYNRMKVRILVF